MCEHLTSIDMLMPRQRLLATFSKEPEHTRKPICCI